ncbi:MAG: 4Fe-4S binding protein [Spirochaetes bacterium]|nr:4Fe-4S binding protein [Spirochaetota bacterium]
MGEKAFFIDEKLCISCGACRAACKLWNNLPNETEADYPHKFTVSLWSRVNSYEDGSSYHEKCRHCYEAKCVASCPENALFYQDGFVVLNKQKCIACGKCETVCPFVCVKVGTLPGETKKTAHKCHACVIEADSKPHCVLNCPTGALSYGNRRRIISKALKLRSVYSAKGGEYVIEGVSDDFQSGVITLKKKRDEKNFSFSPSAGNEKFIYSLVLKSVPVLRPVRRHLYEFISKMLS